MRNYGRLLIIGFWLDKTNWIICLSYVRFIVIINIIIINTDGATLISMPYL